MNASPVGNELLIVTGTPAIVPRAIGDAITVQSVNTCACAETVQSAEVPTSTHVTTVFIMIQISFKLIITIHYRAVYFFANKAISRFLIAIILSFAPPGHRPVVPIGSAYAAFMPQKVLATAPDCFADLKARGIIFDGMTVMVGGFGLCGIPEQLITALRDTGIKNLTCISNNAGVDAPTPWGLGLLLETRQIKKMISSYVGENATFEKQYLGGELEIEFNPQGTLAERIRAGGAGIPAFYTATGVGTIVADGKETRPFFRPYDDTANHNRTPTSPTLPSNATKREYVLETGLFADLALVKASRADEFGNLIYNKTARNFSPMMATAARFVIAEVEDILTVGAFDADRIHTPGNYIDRVVKTVSVKRIEQRTVLGAKKPAKA